MQQRGATNRTLAQRKHSLYGKFQALREPPRFDSFFHLGDSVSRPHVPALSGALFRSRISSFESANRLSSFGGIGHLGPFGFAIRRAIGPLRAPGDLDPRGAHVLGAVMVIRSCA